MTGRRLSGRPGARAAGRRGPAHAARPAPRAWRPQIPGAQRVVVPGVGHAVVGGDPARLRRPARCSRFLARPAGGADCPRVGDRRARHRRAADGAAPARAGCAGMRGRVGRTVAALGVTLDDLAFSLSPAVPRLLGRRAARRELRRAARARDRAAVLGRPRDVDQRRRRAAASCGCGSAAGRRRAGGSRCARAAGCAGASAGGACACGCRATAARACARGVARGGGRPGERVPRAFRREVATLASGSVTRALTALVPSGAAPMHGRQP